MNKNIFVRLATLNLPSKTIAPGTVASLITCVVLFLISHYLGLQSFGLRVPFVAIVFALAVTGEAIRYFKEEDPSIICIDEVPGMLLTLCWIDLSPAVIVLGFLLFRFFDVVKPLGIKRVEKIPGYLGVVLDDVVAGLFAFIGLQLLSCWLKMSC